MTKHNRNKKRAPTTDVQATESERARGSWIWSLAVVGLVAVATFILIPQSDAEEMVVYKDPNCGCCGKWIEHMQAAGYDVRVRNRSDVSPIKAEQGVPLGMRSCHTAVVDGYFIEGHVPAEDVKKLLTQKPSIKGLAVPGMPLGSPGMEVPGREPMKYTVYAVGEDGKTSSFARH